MRRTELTISAVALIASAGLLTAGPLTPPAGPVAPTFKTLSQVEPRTPISSVPFTITQSGSYYLTSNLSAQGSQNGITVSSSFVTIDLNGFTLSGGGTGTGIGVSAQGVSFLTLRNGTIRNFAYGGVSTSGSGRSLIERINVDTCGGIGITTGPSSIIQDCQVASSTSWGITANDGCRVINCTAVNNGTVPTDGGIYAAPRSTIMGCTASYNTGRGIWATIDTIATGCKADYNVGTGIQASNHSVVERSFCSNNTIAGIIADDGVTLRYNTCNTNGVDGIRVESEGTVTHNSCHANGPSAEGAGIVLTEVQTRVDSNDVAGNFIGFQAPAGTAMNILTRNTAHDNTYDYNIATTNILGAILYTPSNNQWSNISAWTNIAY